MRDGRGGGILSDVIEQADLLCVRILREDQVHDRVGVEIIGGAGQVAARLLQRFDQPDGNGVGNRGKDDGRFAVLGGRLHCNGDRRRDRDEEIRAIGLEVGDDLRHQAGVGVAVVIEHVEGNVLLLSDGGQLRTDAFNDLIERGIVHIVADADGIGLAVVFCGLAAAGSKEREGKNYGKRKRDDFFHGIFQPFTLLY